MNRFSTKDSIEYLWEQNHCSDTELVRLIQVYYANYISDWDPETRLSIQEMMEIYKQSQELISDFRAFANFAIRTSWPNEKPRQETIEHEFLLRLSETNQELWKNIQPVRYQLRMIGDVGATLLMISDIVNRQLHTSHSLERFLWIDLGTGTGILLAAQDILARKHGYQKRELHGIELAPAVVQKTRNFCHKLGYIIHEWDTTNSPAWDNIPSGFINFISNENIPAAHEPMSKEPFLENMECAHDVRGDDISSNTWFAPKYLEIKKDSRTCDQDILYVATPENEFCTEEIGDDGTKMADNNLGDLLTLLYPYMIMLEWVKIPLRLVSQFGAERIGEFGYRRGFMSRF